MLCNKQPFLPELATGGHEGFSLHEEPIQACGNTPFRKLPGQASSKESGMGWKSIRGLEALN